jgi:hypothetical protein
VRNCRGLINVYLEDSMEDEDKEPVDGWGIPLTFEMGDFGITLLLDA